MIPSAKPLSIAALAALTIAGPAQAAPASYVLDPQHMSVVFVVGHMGYSNLIGRFNQVSGELKFDKVEVSGSSVKVVIDTASVDTNHAKRDEHLRSPDFFNAKEFPQMTFASKSVVKTGEATGKLAGELTMLGVTRPVVLEVTFNKDAASPITKKDTVGFSARGRIKRSEFGMKYGVPNLGDDVELLLEAEAIRQ